jgi:hypothetical protein
MQGRWLIIGNFLERLSATNRLYGDSRFELRDVGSMLAHLCEPLSSAVPLIRT